MFKKNMKKILSTIASLCFLSTPAIKKTDAISATGIAVTLVASVGGIALLRLIAGMAIKSIVFGDRSNEENKFLRLIEKVTSDKLEYLKVPNVSSYPELGTKLVVNTKHVQCPFKGEILHGIEYSFETSFVENYESSNKSADIYDLEKDNTKSKKKNSIKRNKINFRNESEIKNRNKENINQRVKENLNELLGEKELKDQIPYYSFEKLSQLTEKFVEKQNDPNNKYEFSNALSSQVNEIRNKLNLEGKYILYNGQMWNPANMFIEYSGYLQDVLIYGGKIVVYEYPERYAQGRTSPLKWLTRNDKRLVSSKRAVYDNMAELYGGENIIVCGYSMGGNISIRLTKKILEDGKKLAGLILISPAHATYDCLRTYGKAAGWSDTRIDILTKLGRAGVAEVPGFPEFDKAKTDIEEISKHEDFPIYLTTGNSKDFFYLKYTGLGKSFNGKNQLALTPKEKDKNGNEISVAHDNDKDMIWGKKFENWLRLFDKNK